LDDDFSSTATILGSYTTENTSEEILQFTLDETALQNAQELLNENSNNDDQSEEKISWNDIDNLETESVITELKENNNYQLEDISNQSLTSYVVLDIIDSKI